MAYTALNILMEVTMIKECKRKTNISNEAARGENE